MMDLETFETLEMTFKF